MLVIFGYFSCVMFANIVKNIQNYSYEKVGQWLLYIDDKYVCDKEKLWTIIGYLLYGYIIITLKHNNKKLIDRKITTNHVKP